MKNVITLLGLFICINAIGQTNKTIYYDADWKEITDKNKAHFYRKIEDNPKKKGHLIVKDYYITGEIQMNAQYSSLNPDVHDGAATFYYKNGNMNSKRFFVAGIEKGDYKEWYPQAKIKEEGRIENDKKTGVWKLYYTNGKLRTKGNYLNGLREGEWITNTLSGKPHFKYTYKKDVIVKAEFIDAKEGYFQVLTDLKEEDKDEALTPFVNYSTKAEYRVMNNLIKRNIDILKNSPDAKSYGLISIYTLLWVSNNPNLGKFDIMANSFMMELTNEKAPKMAQTYMMGIAAYKFENKGISNWNKAHTAATEYVIKRYMVLRDKDTKNKYLDKLAKIYTNGKLSDYIKNHK